MKNNKKLFIQIVLIVMALFVGFGIRYYLEHRYEKKSTEESGYKHVGRELVYADPVGDDNAILQIFQKDNPNAEVIIACEEDVTDDGCKDLVVICHIGKLTRTIIAIDSGDGVNFNYTEPIPAPIENQRIQFNNIDKEGEIEFVITGEKKGAVGYAIYRMIDGEPVDLFGEGMEDCC